jgi:hypothetical protein
MGGSFAFTVPYSGIGDLEVGQHFQQEGLEGFVGAVEFVDQQHRWHRLRRVDGLQERAADQETFAEEVVRQLFAALAFAFGEADLQHLARVVPLVGGAGEVQALVALQADQRPAQHGGQRLRDLGLAGAGLAFQEQRALQLQRQEHRGGERALGHVVQREQVRRGVVDARGQGGVGHGAQARGSRWSCGRLEVEAVQPTARAASTGISAAR